MGGSFFKFYATPSHHGLTQVPLELGKGVCLFSIHCLHLLRRVVCLGPFVVIFVELRISRTQLRTICKNQNLESWFLRILEAGPT